MTAAHEKLEKVRLRLLDLESVLIAYSGGVDSTFLLKVAHDTLNSKAVALTAISPTYPPEEIEEAKRLCNKIGIKQILADSNEMNEPNFASNPPDRCYYCKTELFDICVEKAKEEGLSYILDGTNADDEIDYRPGRKAAKEHSILSPLKEAGFTKQEIRELSREMGIDTWDKPSFACLSSRFPYGTEITDGRLRIIGDAERFLKTLGFRIFRVRYHDKIARLELGEEDFRKILDLSTKRAIADKFKSLGFTYVTLDIEGYRQGSMNEALNQKKAGG
ncbi:MAG TPA: ATP-dependent sacrificial sulfur transferase LarE [bacterium]